jgi:hypothetical protein
MDDILLTITAYNLAKSRKRHASHHNIISSLHRQLFRLRFKLSAVQRGCQSRRRLSSRRRRNTASDSSTTNRTPLRSFIRSRLVTRPRILFPRSISSSVFLRTSYHDTPVPIRRSQSLPEFGYEPEEEEDLEDLELQHISPPRCEFPPADVSVSVEATDIFTSPPVSTLLGNTTTECIHREITNTISKELGKRISNAPGVVYILKDTKHTGEPPRLRFGYGAVYPNSLLKKGFDPVHYKTNINHAFRVEQLCRAELASRGTDREGGSKSYYLTESLAKEIIDRWVSFLQKRPYIIAGHLREDWKLRLETMHTVLLNENSYQHWDSFIDFSPDLLAGALEDEAPVSQLDITMPEVDDLAYVSETEAISVPTCQARDNVVIWIKKCICVVLYTSVYWLVTKAVSHSFAITCKTFLYVGRIPIWFLSIINQTKPTLQDAAQSLQVHDNIIKYLRQILTEDEDFKTKYVYIMRVPTHRNKIPRHKIGVTYDLKSRRRSLRSHFGQSMELVGTEESTPIIKHATRAEMLVKQELAPLRDKKEISGKRRSVPREIFFVEEDVITQCRDRWVEFLRKEPYDEDGVLKKEWESRLAKMEDLGKHQTDNHDLRHKRWTKFIRHENSNWKFWSFLRVLWRKFTAVAHALIIICALSCFPHFPLRVVFYCVALVYLVYLIGIRNT